MLDVPVISHQLGCQQIEEFLTPGPGSQGRDGMDDTPTQQPSPEPVDEVSRQPAVLRPGHQFGQLPEPLVPWGRWINLPKLIEQPAGGRHAAGRLFTAVKFQRRFGCNRSEVIGLLKCPAINEGVVAAGAFQVDAEKGLADVLGELDRHCLAGVDRTSPDDAIDKAPGFIGRSNQFPDELVKRLVLDQRPVQPARDLSPATRDKAGAGVVVAKQVIPERQPVLAVP